MLSGSRLRCRSSGERSRSLRALPWPLLLGRLLDGLQRLHDVDKTGTLEFSLAAKVDGGLHQDLLEPLGLADELGADRQERRGRAGNVRGGHTGARLLTIEHR